MCCNWFGTYRVNNLEILNASGIIPIVIDLNPNLIDLAKKNGAQYTFNRHIEGLENTIMDITRGYGADAVIITTAITYLDLVNFAGIISRKKRRIIIVGVIPTGFNKKNYYKKELDL